MKIHRQTQYGVHTWGDKGAIRSSGIHVSGIIKVLSAKHGVSYPESSITERQTRFAVGFAWEEWLVKQIPGLIHQPGPYQLDGVWMNPDGVTNDDIGVLLHEMKATWTSAAKPIQDRIMWLWQCMSYLAGVSATFGEKCTRAVIHPLYMNGDYKENRHPIYAPVMLEFEWGEIEKNWELMLAYKEQAKAEEWL
jgi:hypothetical protein